MTEDDRTAAIRKRVTVSLKALKGLPVDQLLLLKAAINLEISLQQPNPISDREARLNQYWNELYGAKQHESTRKTA